MNQVPIEMLSGWLAQVWLDSWVLATSSKRNKHPCEKNYLKDGQSAGEEANLEATLGTSGLLKAKSARNMTILAQKRRARGWKRLSQIERGKSEKKHDEGYVKAKYRQRCFQGWQMLRGMSQLFVHSRAAMIPKNFSYKGYRIWLNLYSKNPYYVADLDKQDERGTDSSV